MKPHKRILKNIRLCMAIVIAGLAISGITAIPLTWELKHGLSLAYALSPALGQWIAHVLEALTFTQALYPFLAYGTDWLAFAHIMLAVLFIGPLKDPVRNSWVIRFGLIACASIIPFALVFGALRGIPAGWQLVDCSFGIVCAILLLIAQHLIHKLEAPSQVAATAVRASTTPLLKLSKTH